MKVVKTVATKKSDFKAKMHQIVCRLGLCPRARWGSGKGEEGREMVERGGEGSPALTI